MLIRIVNVPPGEAPEKIRQDWVGVTMMVDEVETLNQQGPASIFQCGVLGGNADPSHFSGFAIKTTVAINALITAGKKDAADWWGQIFNKAHFSHLVFGKKFCEIVEVIPD